MEEGAWADLALQFELLGVGVVDQQVEELDEGGHGLHGGPHLQLFDDVGGVAEELAQVMRDVLARGKRSKACEARIPSQNVCIYIYGFQHSF